MSWPHDPRPWGEAAARGAFLGALYSVDVPNRETSHDDFRTVDDPSRTHRAGVRWTDAVMVDAARVRWRAGYTPTRWRLLVEVDGGATPVTDWRADAAAVEVPIDRICQGVVIEQSAGGGSADWPGVMRISALSLRCPARALPVQLDRDGKTRAPRMPLATDGTPWTALDASDAECLRWTMPWQRLDGVRLDIRRVGEVADPETLRRWLSRREPLLFVDERPAPCARRLELGAVGIVAGLTTVALVPLRPTWGRRVRLQLPTPPHAMAVQALRLEAATGLAIEPAAPVPAPALTVGPGPYALAAFEGGTHGLRHAMALGLPGTDARVGVLPEGTVVVHGDRYAQTLYLGFAIGRQRPRLTVRRVGGRTSQCVLAADDGQMRVRAMVVADPRPTLVLMVERDPHLRLLLAAAQREGLGRSERPIPEIGLPFAPPRSPLGEWVATLPPEATTTVRIPLGEAPAGDVADEPWIDASLPGRFGPLLEALQTQADLFRQRDETVAYGLYPSVYAGDVFGLEEDYLFRGMAGWGRTATALAGIRATYLTDAHLAKRHYLHDLRNGLTPWQLEHLLRLAGVPFSALPAEERARIEALGTWTMQQRRRTADADGGVTDAGWRIFPGLLPPFRYGGDLDFPTQSLYVNVANYCGLRAVARMTGQDLGAELADYRGSILAAFDAMRAGAHQPLHSGGDDPADYYQLMACGILDPLDFFAPGDPRAARIDAWVEDDDRLFSALPRFNGWGSGDDIDAVYCHGYLLNALRAGRREVFWTGLLGLFAHAMDRDRHTFREVGPIQRGATVERPHWLPGRRLTRSEPCVGSVGVGLQLLRNAVITELPEADGALGRRLRICGGVLPGWWDAAFHLVDAPTLAGPVTVRWDPETGLSISAPGATAVEWVDRAGTVRPW